MLNVAEGLMHFWQELKFALPDQDLKPSPCAVLGVCPAHSTEAEVLNAYVKDVFSPFVLLFV